MSFETAQHAFDDPHHLSVQDRHESGEGRWQTLGLVGGVVVLLVAHPHQETLHGEVLRIISARKATQHERKRYEEGI
ncbi:MAG: BrnT family toxin [Sedimenticola sp.]